MRLRSWRAKWGVEAPISLAHVLDSHLVVALDAGDSLGILGLAHVVILAL